MLTYGCENFALNRKDRKKIEWDETKFLQWVSEDILMTMYSM